MDIGARLRELRNGKKLSARRLGIAADLDQTTIYKLERNEVMPSLRSLERICNVLDITLPDFFLAGDGLNPDLRRLLDAARGLDSKQIDLAVKIIRAIRE